MKSVHIARNRSVFSQRKKDLCLIYFDNLYSHIDISIIFLYLLFTLFYLPTILEVGCIVNLTIRMKPLIIIKKVCFKISPRKDFCKMD